jgi:hypothetical protein
MSESQAKRVVLGGSHTFRNVPFDRWEGCMQSSSLNDDHHHSNTNMDTSRSVEKRQVSLESSDCWNDEDDSGDMKDGLQWNVPDDVMCGDDSSCRTTDEMDGMLIDFVSGSDIFLGVSISDHQQELTDDAFYYGGRYNNSRSGNTKTTVPDDDDEEDQMRYIDELCNSSYYDGSFNSEEPAELEAFRKRRADLAASMEQSKKTRLVLQQHMQQRGSLARVLSDIEKSSKHVQMMIEHDDES